MVPMLEAGTVAIQSDSRLAAAGGRLCMAHEPDDSSEILRIRVLGQSPPGGNRKGR